MRGFDSCYPCILATSANKHLLKLKKTKLFNKNFFFFNKHRSVLKFKNNDIKLRNSQSSFNNYFHLFIRNDRFDRPILAYKPNKFINNGLSSTPLNGYTVFQNNLTKLTLSLPPSQGVNFSRSDEDIYRIGTASVLNCSNIPLVAYNFLLSFFFKRKLLHGSIGFKRNLIKLDSARLLNYDSFFADTDTKPYNKFFIKNNIVDNFSILNTNFVFLNNLFYMKHNLLLNDRLFNKFFFDKYSRCYF